MRFFRLTQAGAVLALTAVCFAAGCGGSAQSRVDPHTGKYRNDGYHGLTNSFPNAKTDAGYRSYDYDLEMLRQAAMSVPGVKHASVRMGETEARITLTVDANADEDALARIQQQGAHSAALHLPNHPVEVIVQREQTGS